MSAEENGNRANTEARLWELFNKKKERGEPTGPTSFAKEAGISRGYLYTFPELAAEVAAYAKKTQPRVSLRGAGVTRLEAKKRAIEDRVRREHTRWSKEVPELKEQLRESEDERNKISEEKDLLQRKYEMLQRAYELLLMLASEAGVSPAEMEALQQKLSQELPWGASKAGRG